ncbi:MAG: hypothetical protein IH985_02470 [Planctomycetes bacterium]|nr:hypothetical protein [Planctomycetota bacterium]
MPDYAKYVEVARAAVAEACVVCRQVQSALDQVRSITKDDLSPVTVADFASQAIIGRALRAALGRGVILVAEETSHFLRGREHDAHLTATLEAVSAVWPQASADELLDAIDVGAGDTHHGGFWTLDPIDGTKGFLRGQQYAVVGRGQADAYLRLPAKKGYIERIWDHAAGSLIATEGGCFVTDIHGRALDFSHGRGLQKNVGIVCAPPRVHGALIEAIDVLGIEAE